MISRPNKKHAVTQKRRQSLRVRCVIQLMPKRTPNTHRRLLNWSFILAVLILPSAAAAQYDAVKVPDEVRRFVTNDTIPIALESGDLNADGQQDLVLVLSEVVPEDAPYEEGAGERSVL